MEDNFSHPFLVILSAYGSIVDSMSLSHLCLGADVLNKIPKQCSCLRELKLESPGTLASLDTFWTSMGDRLQVAEIKGSAYYSMMSLDSMVLNCSSVPRVTLGLEWNLEFHADTEISGGSRSLSLRKVQDGSAPPLRQVLSACRPTLESLSISRTKITKHVASAIAESCQGDRLMSLKLSNSWAKKRELATIAEACPRILITIPFNEYDGGGGSRSETVAELGRAAGTDHMSWRDTNCSRSFDLVGRSCPNLQNISVRNSNAMSFSAASFGGLFVLPKTALRHMFIEQDDMSIVLSVLADKIDSLNSFSCSCYTLSVEPLRRFVQSQKGMKKIRFCCKEWCSCHNLHYRSEY